jgi:hypothetical protein
VPALCSGIGSVGEGLPVRCSARRDAAGVGMAFGEMVPPGPEPMVSVVPGGSPPERRMKTSRLKSAGGPRAQRGQAFTTTDTAHYSLTFVGVCHAFDVLVRADGSLGVMRARVTAEVGVVHAILITLLR